MALFSEDASSHLIECNHTNRSVIQSHLKSISYEKKK